MPSDTKTKAAFSYLHRLIDCTVILLMLPAVVYSYDPVSMGPRYWFAAIIAVFGFIAIAEMTHLYSSWRVYAIRQELAELTAIYAAVGVMLVVIAFVTKTSDQFSRGIFLLWWCMSLSILMVLRFAVRTLLRVARSKAHNLRTVAIAGAGKLGCRVAERMLGSEWLGLRLVGFYDEGIASTAQAVAGRHYGIEGDLASLVQLAKRGGVDYVYVALPLSHRTKVVDLIRELSDTTASVFLVPDVFVSEIMHARWTEIGDMPVVSVFETPFLGVDGWLKRLEDLALLFVILIPILPLILLIALGVKFSSPGPVLFKQRRYGLSGKVVEIWKFRTMSVLEDGVDVPQARRSDPRVTRFGSFLRRTSLDELPQFFNVFQGHMSVVGPRPHAVAHNEQYRKLVPGYMLRHKVKPGITGWAQVNGWRGETDTVEKMQRRVDCDLYYIRNWSIWLDIKIVVLTALRGFKQPAAY
jgi:putative colanic acid biosynthesis UDP-glucose lipid carrier transferase